MKKILVFISLLVLVSILTLWFYPTNKQPDLSQYSDPDYAKFVELQAYLMTSEQVANLFVTNPNGIPDHWNVEDAPKPALNSPMAKHTAYLKPLYLVIRIKNNGSKYIWGTLNCHLPSGGSTEIETLQMKPNNVLYQNIVKPIYTGGILYEMLKAENPYPEWNQIYTKPI